MYWGLVTGRRAEYTSDTSNCLGCQERAGQSGDQGFEQGRWHGSETCLSVFPHNLGGQEIAYSMVVHGIPKSHWGVGGEPALEKFKDVVP